MLITAGMSLAAFGAGTQVRGTETSDEGKLRDFSAIPLEITEAGSGWKYHPIDPKKAADDSYAMFADGACHYSSFRSIVTNVAQALMATGDATNVQLARNYLAFPFYMMVYGQGGIAYYGSLCGAVNGCAAAISVFVPDRTDKYALIQDLCVYSEETALPIYVPKEDKHPGMPRGIAKSVVCHLSLANWAAAGEKTLEDPMWVERCMRLTSDLVIRTIELLNAYHADRPKAIESRRALMSETQSCMECHTHNQGRFDSFGKMNCTACHTHPVDSECPRHHQSIPSSSSSSARVFERVRELAGLE